MIKRRETNKFQIRINIIIILYQLLLLFYTNYFNHLDLFIVKIKAKSKSSVVVSLKKYFYKYIKIKVCSFSVKHFSSK